MDLRWGILAGYGPLFVSGLLMTIQLTLVAIGAGLVLGIAFGLVSSSADAPQPKTLPAAWLLKAARGVTLGYVTFFRGTPLFVQILLVHFALMPTLVHPDHGLLLAGEAARDFRQEHGAFFSYPLIFLFNIILTALLIRLLLAQDMSYPAYLIDGIMRSMRLIVLGITKLYGWIAQ